MKKLKITYRSLAELKPYQQNARTHSKTQVQQIAASIREFGWTTPLVLDGTNGILAGHGRMEAASLLKLTEVPTVDVRGLSAAQKRAYVLADNKLAEAAGWNPELLLSEIEALDSWDFDLGTIGLGEFDLGDGPGDIADGIQGPGEIGGNTARDCTFQFGEFRVLVPHEVYDRWISGIRSAVGYEEKAIKAEINRRLQI